MTTSPEIANKIKNLSIHGDVSVERVSKIVSQESVGFFVFVILGPTGSGKSTFIESLSPNTSLGLSSNKLEGFTQSVSIYRVVNVKARRLYPIYLVDVPGFADSKISAMGIVSMLKKTIQETKELLTFRILYLTPINNPRLPGSQRRVLRIFEALTGPQSAPRITIVSTMWDLVWSDSARHRAISNFDQLQNDIWKGYIDKGSRLVKFENTYTSALRVLDDSAGHMPTVSFNLQKSISLSLGQAAFASHIYNDLQSRIQDLKLQQANIHSDLQDATDRSDNQGQTPLSITGTFYNFQTPHFVRQHRNQISLFNIQSRQPRKR
ncbi:hypothetical protein BJ165DRAFT_1508327 [Panaeolus papilionaceus]|nr:hypothetical protein BJ165DRAFT_1508327 [Panaeolus papilionaceus]